MASLRGGAADLERCRRVLMARAAFEREAMRMTTADLQDATDHLARIAVMGIRLVHQFWLPAGLLMAGSLSRRARPVLRAVRTGLAVWQAVQMLRKGRG